jgi:glycosyltransferase involved in cell wall biosynthesis
MCAEELVSIVIPTFNEEGNIEKILMSVAIQNHRSLSKGE